jgi:hypothetical protein
MIRRNVFIVNLRERNASPVCRALIQESRTPTTDEAALYKKLKSTNMSVADESSGTIFCRLSSVLLSGVGPACYWQPAGPSAEASGCTGGERYAAMPPADNSSAVRATRLG